MSAPKKRLLPFFLPMAGCAQACVYCDQRAVSGHSDLPTLRQVAAALDAFDGGDAAELAYYGGSFTCLPRAEQEQWLLLAAPYISSGRLAGVRVSTRPDAVDAEVCRFLQAHGVTTVELGLQSMSDTVLLAARRGCTARQNRAACQAVLHSGLTLGGQLMLGLPADDAPQALASLQELLELGCRLLRIYPTLVLRDTELARLWQAGEYQAMSLDAAVGLSADMLELALAAAATVQRIGLPPSPQLEQSLLAGPYHPAFGGLVKQELLQRQARALLLASTAPPQAVVSLYAHPCDLPLLFGHKKTGRMSLEKLRPNLRIKGDSSLSRGQLRLG